MERLLTLKLDAVGCEAEALLNGVPLARAHAGRPRMIVPVHEYTLAGSNRLELVIWPYPAAAPEDGRPAPLSLQADGQVRASARILLPRTGNPVDEASARCLAELMWHPPAGERYQAPLLLQQDGQLPVNFPRWRWADAPAAALSPALHAQAHAMLRRFQDDLAGGLTTNFLSELRLRTEELAVAYQRPSETLSLQLREHLEALHQAGRLKWVELAPDALVLRRIAGGRLLECLTPDGAPALRTQPDEHGRVCAFPLRMAAVENRLYVLR